MDFDVDEPSTSSGLVDACVRILRAAGWRLKAVVRPHGQARPHDFDLAFVRDEDPQGLVLVRLIENVTSKHVLEHASLVADGDFVGVVNVSLRTENEWALPCIRPDELRAVAAELGAFSGT